MKVRTICLLESVCRTVFSATDTMFKLLFASHLKMIAFFNSAARRRWWYKLVNFHWALNWCPVIVSIRQQVSPILSLAVISLLIDQWGGLLRFKFSVGCKIFDCYDILLNLITKVTRGLRKYKYTLRYFIPASNLVDFIVSETLMNHMLDHPGHFFTVQSYFP